MNMDQKREIVRKAEELNAQGYSFAQAAAKLKVGRSSLDFWRRHVREESYPNRTIEEERAACAQVDALRATGKSITDACHEVQISQSFYREHRRVNGQPLVNSGPRADRALTVTSVKAKTRPTLHTFNFDNVVKQQGVQQEYTSDESPMMLLVGKEAAINKALGQLVHIWSK